MTKPLDQILKEITPLPYECYGPSKIPITFDHESFVGPTTAHAGPISVVAGDTPEHSLFHAAYLSHAANVLPELVEALQLLRDFQNGCPLPSYERHWNRAMALSLTALKKATNIEMP